MHKKLFPTTFFFLSLLFIFLTIFIHAYQYEVSVCAIFQDEAPYLKEWIEHHEEQGVQHFWLYNNNSTDNYREVLQPYINKQLVELIEWPQETKNIHDWNHVQCIAYTDCIQQSKDTTKWCAFIDIDEFLFCPTKTSLEEALVSYEKFGGVGVNWVTYGTSNVEKIMPYEKLVDKLVYRANLNNPHCLHIKTIAQPSRVIGCVNPHYFFYTPNQPAAVTENKEPVHGPFTAFNSVEKFRINHYWSKDKHFFYNNKLPRQCKWGINSSNAIRCESELNEVYDPILSRY